MSNAEKNSFEDIISPLVDDEVEQGRLLYSPLSHEEPRELMGYKADGYSRRRIRLVSNNRIYGVVACSRVEQTFKIPQHWIDERKLACYGKVINDVSGDASQESKQQ